MLRAHDFEPRIAAPPQGARLVQPLPDEDNDMPRGIYPRIGRFPGKPAETESSKPPITRKKRAARAKPAPNGDARRFGVFDDGSVVIETAACKGTLAAEEAAALVEFIGRLRGRAA